MADDPATLRAVASLTKANAQNQALGGSAPKSKPSILSRIFDVISRPLYGVSEPIARLTEGKSALSALEGVGAGLAGKNKTDVGQIITRGAEHSGAFAGINKNHVLKAALTLAGDVALDPTTYLAPEISLPSKLGDVAKAGLEAGTAATRTAEAGKAIEEAGQAAKGVRATNIAAKVAEAAKAPEAVATTEDDVRKAVKSIMSQGKKAESIKTAELGSQALEGAKTAATEAGGKGSLDLKFMGKKIASSEKAYAAGKAAKDAFTGSEIGGALTRSFNEASKFPERTNIFRRETAIKGVAQSKDEVNAIHDAFKGLTGEEKRAVSHAREAGQTTLEVNGKDLTPHLQFLSDFYNGKKASLDAAKVPFNQIEDGIEHGDTYVHHHYDNLTKEQAKNLKIKAVGSDTPGITLTRKFDTLAEATAKGYQPVEEADRAAAIYSRKANAAIARREYVDKVVEAYGHELKPNEASMAKQAGWKQVKDVPGVPEGTWLPDHINKTIQAMEKVHTSDADAKTLMTLYDKSLHNMKFGISLSPAHFARRAMTGVWQNFLDGVTNPDRYRQAAQLMATDAPEKMGFRIGDLTQTGEDIKRLMRDHGAEGAFFQSEFGPESALGKFKNKAYAAANQADQATRTAHFIDALKDEGKGAKTVEDVNKAAENAGARVRKWNGDFGDTTKFEQKFMKRMVPYYSFSRQTIPRQIEAIAMRPGKVLAIPKGIAAMQALMGTGQGYNQPSGQVIPDWLKRAASVELPGEGNFMKPNIPFQQVGQYSEGGLKGIMGNLFSQITPALRIPGELGTGTEAFTGQKIKSTPRYLAGQVPILTEIYDALNSAKTKQSDIPALSRYVGASGVYHVTPAQQAAQLQAQASKVRSQVRARKKNLAK